jgi:quinol---cytochrome c reductase iron-sulfur subunit, bacillus type
MGAQSETVDTISTKRRTFMGVISGLIASSIAAVLGVTIGRYAIVPALNDQGETEWAELGALAGIPEGKPVRRNVLVSLNAGWGRFNTERLVWVIRQGETLTVFTAVCPHLGCTVSARAEGFVCPCHSSKWDARGERLSGPSPRGLDVLEHRIEGDKLKIKYQNFRHGTPAKEVMG